VQVFGCQHDEAIHTHNSRRPKSAGARNRGVQGAAAAATYQRAMGI